MRLAVPFLIVSIAGAGLVGCSTPPASGGAAAHAASASADAPSGPVVAFVGVRIIDGSGAAPIDDGVLVVRGGTIAAVGAATQTTVPADARRVDLRGRTIVPGLINTHGHVNDVRGLTANPAFYTREHVEDQLRLQARYGVTTVFSLGGDGPAGVEVRDAQQKGALDMARLFVAGPIITATDPAEARRHVDEAAAMKVDLIKIRVDDFLGTRPKLPPAAYTAIIDQAHKRTLEVAAHIVTLDDAKRVVEAGADFIAHSVRDVAVDEAFVKMLRARDVCVSPTLMREVSTFTYESRPAFFDDPFFRREVEPATIQALEAPAYQATTRASKAAQYYKQQYGLAQANLLTLSKAGVRIAFGTDSGPPGRFQGYFEHLELEEMVEAGLTPLQAIVSATGDAARCMNVADRLGTLAPGRQADFLVLARNPLEDIRHTRTIESVWIRGSQVPARAPASAPRAE